MYALATEQPDRMDELQKEAEAMEREDKSA